MTLNQIRYFQTIARTGSVGQAAKSLYLAQPSLSISMNHLEEELNVTLFDHIGHHLRLTPAGEIFLKYADKILQDVEDAARHMEALSERQEHILRLGCVEPAFNRFVPYIMRQFLDIPKNSETQFELFTGITEDLVGRLRKGEMDLLISSASDNEAVVQKELYTMPLALLGPGQETGNQENRDDLFPLTWKGISELPLIGYTPGSAMDYLLTKVAEDEHIKLNYIYTAPNEEAIAALVHHGFGYGIVPVADTLTARKDLSLYELPGNHYQTIYLTWLSGRKYRGAAADFITFMKSTAFKMQ